jgi:3-oxoacyl-[acyl-carrier protein] reductase
MKRALVTGGQSGIGAACIERFKAEGIETISLDLHKDADLAVDVSDSTAISKAIAAAGPIDILVNCAGVVGPTTPLWEIEAADWDKTFAVNVRGTFNTCHAVIPGMIERKWGRIVNISSVAGKEGNPNLSAYSASKAAVLGLTKSLGKELAQKGVVVNAITPGVIATPMNKDTSEQLLEYMISRIPMGRTGTAVEVAALIYWLSSDQCTFSTGSVFDISGGRTTY